MHPCWWKILSGLQNHLMGSEIAGGEVESIPTGSARLPAECYGKNQCPQSWACGGDLPGRRASPVSPKKEQEGAGV